MKEVGSRMPTREEWEILNRKTKMKTKQYTYQNKTRCLIPEVKEDNPLKEWVIWTAKTVFHISRAICLLVVGLILMASVYWTGIVLFNGQWDDALASGVITALLGIITYLLYDEKNY